jgi:iron-sulfur cluster repair protein YtfE (RIC family)
MEKDRDILDIIYSAHTEGKEKFVVLDDMIDVIYDNNKLLAKTGEFLSFFEKHTAKHFKNEELLIGMLKKETELSESELDGLEEILSEHITLNSALENIKKSVSKLRADENTGKLKKRVFKLIHALVNDIMKHAEKEDAALYPLAREKMSPLQKERLEEKIRG